MLVKRSCTSCSQACCKLLKAWLAYARLAKLTCLPKACDKPAEICFVQEKLSFVLYKATFQTLNSLPNNLVTF